MNKILLIIQREYLTRVKKKSFIIMTILGPLLMAGLMVGAIYMSLSLEDNQKILVVDENRTFTIPDKEALKFEYSHESLEEVKQNFHKTDYTGILFIPPNVAQSNTVAYYFKQKPGIVSLKYIESKLEERIETFKLKVHKIDPEKYFDVKTNLHINTISFKKPGMEQASSAEAGYVGFFFAILIYFFIFLYGVQVMRGVIEEKTNRIVEVIISSVKPFQLMMGKIVGVALVGLTQFLLWVVLTAGITLVAQAVLLKDKYDPAKVASEVNMSTDVMSDIQKETKANDKDLSSGEIVDVISRINFPYMIGLFIFYFLGGYLLYAALFAAIGSAVDNEADTQQFMMPVTIPLIFGFVVAQMAVQNPEGPMASIFSIIPLTSPVVMMIRIASVPFSALVWELLLSMGLLAASFIFTTWIAGRIYRTGILMYGKKVNYRELWKWLFYRA